MKLSVITINRNNKKGLEKTLKSIYPLDSNISDQVEHIIIDGDSTDGSVELIREYSTKYGLTWTSEKDSGIFNAMNKGLDKIMGEFVIFMNSGDVFCENILGSSLFTELDGNDVVYGNIYVNQGARLTHVNQTDELDFLYMIGKTICHQSVFMKSSLCKKYKFVENIQFSLMGDWIQLFDMLRNELLIVKKINQDICVYDADGVSDKIDGLRQHQRLVYLKKYYGSWELNQFKELSRLRNRKYFRLFVNSLTSYKATVCLNFISKWILR
jgi:glycosyltransferase involved in cell wall biosynthesis